MSFPIPIAFSRRVQIILLTVFQVAVSYFINNQEYEFYVLLPLIVFISLLGLKLILKGDLELKSGIFLVLIPILVLDGNIRLYNSLPKESRIYQFFPFISCILMYVSYLTVNIINVASVRGSIPLLRPARAFIHLLAVMNFLLSTLSIYRSELGPIYQVITIFLGGLLNLTFFVYSLIIPIEKFSFKRILLPSFLVSSLFLEVVLVLSIFPMVAFTRAVLLASIYYSFLGVLRHWKDDTLNYYSILEYIILIVLLTSIVPLI